MNEMLETAKIGEFFDEITEHEKAGRMAMAYGLAERVAQAAPQLAAAHNMAGLLAFRRKQYELALTWLTKAMELDPDDAAYPRNIGLVYHALNRLDDALQMTQRALDLAPDEATLYFNKALILHDRLEIEAGLATAEAALARAPDYAEAHFLKAELLLLSGRLTKGLKAYECRFAVEQGKDMLPKTTKPQWDGRALGPGRLLLVADQGFGDCIQFSRYIPWVASHAPAPTLAASDDLLLLLRQFKEIGKTVRRWDEAGDYDAYMPLSGLPGLAGTTLANIPGACPYLFPDPGKLAVWRARLQTLLPEGRKRVGLVWAGRPTHSKDNKRSLSLAQFAPLFERDDLVLISLQKGERVGDIGFAFPAAPLLNLGPLITDFTDTLAILRLLDQVVSVDTSVAHLAGAAGVPTSLLLPYAPDWRWLLNRDDSPWYPHMRLFRQRSPGDWADVLTRVAASL